MISGPPLPRKKVGFSLGPSSAPIELEVFLDYCCPYSKTAYIKLVDSIIPAMNNQVNFVFQNQIQPWHPQSTCMHEAALAVGRVAPKQFFAYSRLLFEHQEEYFDGVCYKKTREQIYEQLCRLAMDMKFAIKYARKLGIHVSPTYLVNGIEDTAAGSDWNVETWKERLQPLLL
eukprot:jgi/Galph1/5739/GphlegSOOS_G4390.1